MTQTVITTGFFDNIGSRHIRFLCEASKHGKLSILLLDDNLYEQALKTKPKFPLSERQYYLESVKYVERVYCISDLSQLKDITAVIGRKPDGWYVLDSEAKVDYKYDAEISNIPYCIISDNRLTGFPADDPTEPLSSARKVIVTGSFDWFHSGHVRFLEEASEYGDLYAVVGHDKNIELLKGPGHPLFNENERRFIVGSIRFVKKALISTGHGWMDAEPEIKQIKPDVYIVNEDGDKEDKRRFCELNKLEYRVLRREPKPGLTRRTSTNLRGF